MEIEIDAIGLLCPLPVLKLRKRLQTLPPGTLVRLLTSDPASRIDVPHFCATEGHELVNDDSTGDSFAYLVRRGAVRRSPVS